MHRNVRKTLFAGALVCVALAGFFVLRGEAGPVSNAALTVSAQTDYDLPFLSEAAKKYTDPDDIAAIPDEAIIEDFINIAFADSDDQSWLGRFEGVSGYKELPDWIPTKKPSTPTSVTHGWMWDYILRDNTPRQQGAIKKRNSALKIFVEGDGRIWPWPLIKSHLESSIERLHKLTGLKVSFVSDRDSAGLIFDLMGQLPVDQNLFYHHKTASLPSLPPRCHGCSINVIEHSELALKGVVQFTPGWRSQVDGFFLAGNDHAIEKAKCLISPWLEEDVVRALVSECLLRQYGLPDGSRLFRNTVLGAWNRSFDNYLWPVHLGAFLEEGAHYSWDGNPLVAGLEESRFEAAILSAKPLSLGWQSRLPRKRRDRSGFIRELVDWRIDRQFIHTQPTRYDLLLLKLLYSEKIVPGMTPGEVRKVLPGLLPDIRQVVASLGRDKNKKRQSAPTEKKQKQRQPQDIVLGNNEALLEDFLAIALSNADWRAGYWRSDWRDNIRAHSKEPWIREHVRAASGHEMNAITKWAQPIVISVPRNTFGNFPITSLSARLKEEFIEALPEKTSEYASTFIGSDTNTAHHPAIVTINRHVATLLEELRSITGLDIELVDGLQKQTNLIIAPTFFSSVNVFKMPRIENKRAIADFAVSEFKNAVRFTPESKVQVDGYILLNSDNTIDHSVCRIWWNHSPAMIKALVTECLVRALGLPNMAGAVKDSVLSPWNIAHKKYSGHRAAGLGSFKPEFIEFSSFKELQEKIDKRTNHEALHFDLTEYDRLMLRILYGAQIQPGMSKEDIRNLDLF